MSAQLTPLEGIDSSSRLLRTSIYLQNSLNQSDGGVQDLLDCVIPIVSESITQLSTGQIVLQELQNVVQERFSFKMPTYSLEHVLGRLAQRGRIVYEKDLKTYYHEGSKPVEEPLQEDTAADKIARLESAMADYAQKTFDMGQPPVFSEWADILVYFLHPDAMKASSSAKPVKGVLVAEFDEILRRIASRFILACEANPDRGLYEIIIEVYGGILLGDFLQNIQVAGNPDSFKALTVFYDTTILLRLLGCSGSALRKANMEMHEDLRSLGCNTQFLQNNEKEVVTILDTIVSRYDAGLSIFGETGEALSDAASGVNIGILRSLRDSYPESLAQMGIFQSKYTFQNTQTQNFFQIDELKFEEMLKRESATGYSEHNRANDAQSLAVVMRLRQGSKSIDLANSKFVLVSANSHLARTARKFVQMEELSLPPRYVAPILTHSQASIAAWLTSETKLTESFIWRELLANCMSAQQVSKEWIEGFIERMKVASLPDEDKTIIHAVRSIARDQSLGNPTILKKLNPNEVIRMARIAEEQRTQELRAEYEGLLEDRLRESESRVREEERGSVEQEYRERCELWARRIMRIFEVLVMIGCVYVLVRGIAHFDHKSLFSWAEAGGFVLVTSLAIADLFGFRPVQRISGPLRQRLAIFIFKVLYDKRR